MKWKEIVYLVLDELKLHSDDTDFNEEHIIFLADKYRAFLIKQRYSDIKKQVPKANYQEICINLEPEKTSEVCGDLYLRSIEEIPALMNIGNTSVYPKDFYNGFHISLVSRERMRFVGNNKYLQNIIYCSINPDGHLWVKSSNPQFKYLKLLRLTGIFDNAEEASKLSCNSNIESCDILDLDFPLEAALVSPLIELIVKELTVAEYKVADEENNSADDLGNMANYVRLNTKSPLLKLMGL